MAEQEVKFRKPNVNFESILQKQRQMEDDEKFAISDSLQEFIGETTKQAGYQNQEKLDKAGIRQEVINFVDNYTISNLDGLKGADYDEALQTQKSTDKQIEELFKLKGDAKLSKAERDYIETTVGETNKKLGEILGLSTRLKLAFRDFKKELKPLKLANRIGLTQIPIIGKRIERAIRAEEEGEAEALRIKRGLRKRETRGARKAGDLDFAETQPESETQQTKTQAKQVTAQLLGVDQKGPELFGDNEQRVEEERESDTQFESTQNILERILEESELTNELLGKQRDKKGGLLGGGLSEGILATLGIQKFVKFIKGAKLAGVGTTLATFGSVLAGVAATLAAVFAIPAFLAFLNRPQGETELEEMKDQGKDFSGSFMNEGVLQEDIDDENRRRLDAINQDEYKKLQDRGDLDENTTLEQYAKAKKDAGVGQRVTSYITGRLKDAKVEKVMQVLTANSTAPVAPVNMVTNTDTTSITNNTEKKMDNVAQMNESGMNKSVNESSATTNNVVNNNVQQNDNSNNTNKTEYGSTSIGSQNKSGFVDFY